jgi:hypothetical protein
MERRPIRVGVHARQRGARGFEPVRLVPCEDHHLVRVQLLGNQARGSSVGMQGIQGEHHPAASTLPVHGRRRLQPWWHTVLDLTRRARRSSHAREAPTGGI